MQTRSYTELLNLVRGLCGVTSFASNETTLISSLLNRRARRAYNLCDHWPRFLVVGEERTVTSSVIPFSESSLSDIGTFLRIHRTEPFTTSSAQEFDFTVGTGGATLVAGSLDPSSAFVTYKTQFSTTYGSDGGQSADVPAEWFDFIAHGTYADFLRMEGQQEKAAIADAEAMDILTDELLRADSMRPDFLSKTVTHANQENR